MENLQIGFWIFTVYAFMGWILETVFCALRKKTFVNRGFLNGPLCIIYGIAMVLMSVFLQELEGNWVFLFLGCSVTATVVELLGGMLLEHFGIGRWWDYSNKRANLGGYISAGSSILWGVLGVICISWVNPAIIWLLQAMPNILRAVILIVLAAVLAVDFAGSMIAVLHLKHRPRIEEANQRIENITQKLGQRIVNRMIRRMEKAHPLSQRRGVRKKATTFAQGCGYQKIFMLLMIGAFLGDIVETIFVWLTSGVWMSRSSLVWGQFSLVWGLALAGGTVMLYRHRHRSDGFIFAFGFFVGGVFEYFCSVFTELAFGVIFWDYSQYPFNLGGRINLLYCFFWGIAAVIWIKKLYPVLSRWIEKIPLKIGTVAVWALTVFMIVNMAVTCAAMARYSQRSEGIEASNSVAQVIDAVFPDQWMENRYQNMKIT
jgi:uncharacterized membrane protein